MGEISHHSFCSGQTSLESVRCWTHHRVQLRGAGRGRPGPRPEPQDRNQQQHLRAAHPNPTASSTAELEQNHAEVHLQHEKRVRPVHEPQNGRTLRSGPVRSGTGTVIRSGPELTETPRALTTEAGAREFVSAYVVTSARGASLQPAWGRGQEFEADVTTHKRKKPTKVFVNKLKADWSPRWPRPFARVSVCWPLPFLMT